MAKRVTIMIDDKNHKKTHDIQSKLIKKENHSVSFSKVVNMALEKGLDKL